ncbi:MAG: zinc-ribbon domain-containing protein [Sphingomonas sp.]
MILTCPSCGTQYVVKDGAIPPGGRQVRCASCKHSWHQDQEEGSPGAEPEVEAAEAAPLAEEYTPAAPRSEDEEGSFAEAALIEPRSGPEAEERAFEEATIESEEAEPQDTPEDEPPSATYARSQFDISRTESPPAGTENDWEQPPEPEAQPDEFRPYAAADEVSPARRRSPLLAILVVVVVVVAVAAAFWFLAPPDLKARLGLAELSTSPLALVTTHMDRQRLESGNELLTVTGRVINPTGKEQAVPPLQAQLKTRAGKVVYSWTIAPPASSLAPGASAPFNSAEVNVPPGGEELTITLGAKAG